MTLLPAFQERESRGRLAEQGFVSLMLKMTAIESNVVTSDTPHGRGTLVGDDYVRRGGSFSMTGESTGDDVRVPRMRSYTRGMGGAGLAKIPTDLEYELRLSAAQSLYVFSRDMGGARALVVDEALLPLALLARYGDCARARRTTAAAAMCVRPLCSGMRWADVKNYAVCALSNVSGYKDFAVRLSLPRVFDALAAASRESFEPQTREAALRAVENVYKYAMRSETVAPAPRISPAGFWRAGTAPQNGVTRTKLSRTPPWT